jgi:hypothetical protein
MKNLSVIIATVSILGLTACTTTPKQETQNVKTEVEPILVGMPFEQRIALSQKRIMEQRDIWYRYKMGIGTQEYNVVTHNNNMEARKGSSRTLPQAYAKSKDVVRNEERDYMIEELAIPVNKIEWINNSANSLGMEIAKNLGYQFVVNKDKDLMVNVVVSNSNLDGVVKALEKELGANASVLIMPENKTFNIIYK